MIFIKQILYNPNAKFDKTLEFNDFLNQIKNLSLDDQFKKLAEVVVNNNEEPSVINNCKIMLLTKATSGIAGFTVEKNVNYVYNLLQNN